jgi:uncharacterized membrane protein YraQ (UPF0718 family)
VRTALRVVCILGLVLALRAAEPQGLVVRGTVTKSGGDRPVTAGTIELRWPGHEDRFAPVSVPIREDGTYLVEAKVDPSVVPLKELTVTAMGHACELVEKPLPVPAVGAAAGPLQVDFAVESSTLNGILDIFHCCILTWGILTVMLPAFLLAAAVTAFVPSQAILNLLGPDAPRWKSYSAAVASGIILSLCSCNVVPLFAGISRRGAGTGPAYAFLYSGPALDLVPIIFTCQIIGIPFGIFRVAAVSVIAVVTGVFMARIFGEGRAGGDSSAPLPVLSLGPRRRVTWTLVGLLLYLLVVGSYKASVAWRLGLTLPAGLAIVLLAVFGLGRVNTLAWLKEAWALARMVVPVLLPAVLVIGFLAMHTPLTVTRWMSGNNSLAASLGAAAFGSLMYFPMLTEVAFVKALLKVMGVGVGPAMALILTAPGLSLPGMIIIRKEVGWKRMLTYVLITTLLATAAGAFFGSEWGAYICSCAF